MKRSELGYCSCVLYYKVWGKTVVDGKLRSQNWWQRKLEEEINKPTVETDVNLWNCNTAEPAPTPYEIEFNLDA